MKKHNWTKTIGILGTVLGFAATLVSDYSSKKEIKDMVSEEVQKELSKRDDNN